MHENHMMIILMIRTENKGWLCYCHMLLVSKKQKMEHATLKIRVGQKYTGSVIVDVAESDDAVVGEGAVSDRQLLQHSAVRDGQRMG